MLLVYEKHEENRVVEKIFLTFFHCARRKTPLDGCLEIQIFPRTNYNLG